MSEDHLFEIAATIFGTMIVKGEDDVTVFSQVVQEQSGTAEPRIGDELIVRTAVNINDHRVFLRAVKIDGFDHPAIQRGPVDF